jgi:hypothetical protein
MLPDQLDIALKEWAVVQRALLDGRQIIMVRKGGIAEESGDFDLWSRWFLIQPTYSHETERSGDVQAGYSSQLAAEEGRKPTQPVLRFECACEVADVLRPKLADELIALPSEHIWSEQFLRGRFDWEPYKPVTVLIVRTYILPAPVEVPFQPEYGGCTSWSRLAEPISMSGARPAIPNDVEFEHRVDLIRWNVSRM